MYIKKIEDQITQHLLNRIDEDIASIYNNMLTCTNSNSNKPLTLDNLEKIYEAIKPYKDIEQKLYEFSMPKYEIKLDKEEDKFKFLSMYGMQIVKPTRTIYIKVQKFKHKKKRINKKWAKIYGYVEIPKEVPCFGILNICT